MTKYKHFPKRPKKLTAEFAKQQYEDLVARIPEAEKSSDAKLWLALFKDSNELESYISSEGSRISFRFTQDMRNKKSEAEEKYFREKVIPAVTEPSFVLLKSVLESKHRDAIVAEYGEQLVPVYQTAVKPLDPVNTDLRIKAGDLTNDYDQLTAKAMVIVNGEKMTLTKARSLSASEHEAIRKEAYLAVRDWVVKNQKQLSKIYDQLVSIRTQMGKNVGYKNYVPLAYQNRGRTDYGQPEVEKFRANVRKYAVPLYKKIIDQQAAAIGTPTLKPWDSMYHPNLTLPMGIVPVSTQLAAAQRLFDKLDPRLGKHFAYMVDNKLIDLENRAGKRGNAYCTGFSDEGLHLIFCSSTGDPDDISTLVHEMGHAFQGWESEWIASVDLQSPTADLCEVHSMGMEFLSLPHIDEFFSHEHAERFRKNRWKEAVYVLCYVALVDEFQHWVYENPTAKPKERDAKWVELQAIYQPGIDYSGYEQYQATRWYLQLHIFDIPFYYIDYAIAETGAMQLALVANNDHQKALEIYMELCHIGGMMSVLKAFDHAGMRSPFDSKLMEDLMAHAASELGL